MFIGPGRRHGSALAGLLSCALVARCSGDAPAGVGDVPVVTVDAIADTASLCPNDLPAECPTDSPHYADAAAVISQRCYPCHAPGGQSSDKLLTTYAQVYSRRASVLTQVYSCAMPPSTAPQLSPTERALLLAWLVCHAPR